MDFPIDMVQENRFNFKNSRLSAVNNEVMCSEIDLSIDMIQENRFKLPLTSSTMTHIGSNLLINTRFAIRHTQQETIFSVPYSSGDNIPSHWKPKDLMNSST